MIRAPWPRSLAARTALLLLAALTVVQIAGLTIHALDRVDLQHLAQLHDVALRSISAYRSVTMAEPDRRAAIAVELDLTEEATITFSELLPHSDLQATPPPVQRQLRADMLLVPMPLGRRPRDYVFLGGIEDGRIEIGLRLPEGQWLNVEMLLPPPRPWHSSTFLLAFLVMTGAAALLTLWAVRRLTSPVATLAAAAEALGRDVNAPPLPETGPTEVATAAKAFNTMATRIRRFVQDRTFMLSAIGHDLRTPITRLKLRAEFMEDDEQREKMLADLDQLEAMVSATLAFGRDVTADERATRVDLVALTRTVLDETADAHPETETLLNYQGPDSLPVLARPVAIKRALTNLVMNAMNYGGNARVRLSPPRDGVVLLTVEDDGPGIPQHEIERVFQPFQRGEASRNSETGGVGLGLPIVRNIMRAHGGDVTLVNRPEGGLTACITLPQ
jgi:signal transduction histidine kinase